MYVLFVSNEVKKVIHKNKIKDFEHRKSLLFASL